MIKIDNDESLINIIAELCSQCKIQDWFSPVKAKFSHMLMQLCRDFNISTLGLDDPRAMRSNMIRRNGVMLAMHLRMNLPSKALHPSEALAAWETWCFLDDLDANEADFAWDVMQVYIANGAYDQANNLEVPSQ